MVVEALNILMERGKEEGIIRGVRVGRNGVRVSHLQCVDDTIIFCNNEEEILIVNRTLRWFLNMSGLKVNYSKSMLCGVGILEIENRGDGPNHWMLKW